MKIYPKQWAGLGIGSIVGVLVWFQFVLILHPTEPLRTSTTVHDKYFIGLIASVTISVAVWVRVVFVNAIEEDTKSNKKSRQDQGTESQQG